MTIDNFDADSYKDRLREQGMREDVLDDMVEKKKKSLQKSESDFEYVMKLENIGKSNDHIIVAGIATNGALDWDNEVINMDSLRTAWDGYMKNPVLRYMHGKDSRTPHAIGRIIPEYITEDGRTLKTEFRDGNPFIIAEISNAPDIESIRTKVQEGVLRGFSIGGRANRVNEFCHKLGKSINRIFVSRLSEISIVDLPANKDGFFEIVKGCVGDNCSCNIDEMINGDQNDSVTEVQDDDYQDENIVNKIESEEINMAENIENIEMEMSELKEFVDARVGTVVAKMVADQDQIEKLEAGDAAVKEAQDLKARIAELEAEVTKLAAALKAAPQETMKTEEVVEEIVVDKTESEVDILRAEVAELKASPMYKSEQTEIVEKSETVESVSFLSGIIKESYGGN